MTRRELPPQLVQEIRDLAAGWAKSSPDAGPGLDTDFDTMEQLSRAATAGLTEGALSTLLEQQAQALGAQVPCPDCGAPCAVQREPRTLQWPGGAVPQSEPVGHCPACRRDFCPQRPLLRRNNHGYNPAVWRLIAQAAGRLGFFADAAYALELAGLPISPQHARTLAQEVGDDLARQRDAKAAWRRRRLPGRVATTPALVAVEKAARSRCYFQTPPQASALQGVRHLRKRPRFAPGTCGVGL